MGLGGWKMNILEFVKNMFDTYIQEVKLTDQDVVMVQTKKFEKLQKYLKALDIIIKKNVNVFGLYDWINWAEYPLEHYNEYKDETRLTKDEFIILKEVLEDYEEFLKNE